MRVDIGVVECRIEALRLIKSCGIAVLQVTGVDVDERAHVMIACRRHQIVIDIAYLLTLKALQVVVACLNTIDEDLDRLARERLDRA